MTREEAIRRIKAWNLDSDDMEVLSEVIPELRESEDERIRKVIQMYLDWLDGRTIVAPRGEYSISDMISWLEKQGEQKDIDKVEPKFKVGDWIVYEGLGTYKVVEIHEGWYSVIDSNDRRWSVMFEKESLCHLWTIQDAKDGDVLAAYECYVIFKEIDDLNIKCYCTYHYMNNPMFFANTLQNKTAFYPATKKQRDFLFQKMKEAGYEWDAEKKELRNIEQKSVDKVKPKFLPGECIRYRGENYKIKDIEDTKNGFIYNVSIIGKPSDTEEIKTAIGFAAEQDMVKIENSAWSEEDEEKLNSIIEVLDKDSLLVNWLKSLKDRVQPQAKQEWRMDNE